MTSNHDRPRRRLYLVHRWAGLSFALLGMLVFFSGAVATFHHELDTWASRGDRFGSPQDLAGFDLDEAYRVASAGVESKYLHQVEIATQEGRPLVFFFHEHIPDGMGIEEVGVARVVDPLTLEVLDERTGDRREAFYPRASAALAQFFIELHIFLLMPETLGLIATGIAGFALLLLIGTGTLVHRPTARSMITSPRTKRRRHLLGDLHTLIGSWSLPFTSIVALTGAFFSFAGVVLVPVVATVAFDGDQEALIRTLVGAVEVADREETPPLQPLFADAIDRTGGARVVGLGLDRWGERDANATVHLVTPSPVGDESHRLVYDGHTGAFIQAKPVLGTEPSVSDTLLELVAELHFGTLFGIITKLLWGILGFATCALAATGLLVYVSRQRDGRSRASRFVRSMTVALAGGLPLATGAAFLAWIAACVLGNDRGLTAMTWTFLSTLALAGLVGTITEVRRALALTWAGSSLALFGAVGLAPLATGIDLGSVWAHPTLRQTLLVDGALIACAAMLAIGAVTAARGRRDPMQIGEEGLGEVSGIAAGLRQL